MATLVFPLPKNKIYTSEVPEPLHSAVLCNHNMFRFITILAIYIAQHRYLRFDFWSTSFIKKVQIKLVPTNVINQAVTVTAEFKRRTEASMWCLKLFKYLD